MHEKIDAVELKNYYIKTKGKDVEKKYGTVGIGIAEVILADYTEALEKNGIIMVKEKTPEPEEEPLPAPPEPADAVDEIQEHMDKAMPVEEPVEEIIPEQEEVEEQPKQPSFLDKLKGNRR